MAVASLIYCLSEFVQEVANHLSFLYSVLSGLSYTSLCCEKLRFSVNLLDASRKSFYHGVKEMRVCIVHRFSSFMQRTHFIWYTSCDWCYTLWAITDFEVDILNLFNPILNPILNLLFRRFLRHICLSAGSNLKKFMPTFAINIKF